MSKGMNGKLYAKLKKLGVSGRNPSTKMQELKLSDIVVSDTTQRKLRPNRVKQLAGTFSMQYMGIPTVVYRNSKYYVVDGQHRIVTLRNLLGEESDVTIMCHVYMGLSESEEADLFDRLNDSLPVSAIEKHLVRVTAQRPVNVEIQEAVEACGFKIAMANELGSISAIATLNKIHIRGGVELLRRTLEIGSTSYGESFAKSAPAMEGLSLVLQKYSSDTLEDDTIVEALRTFRGGLVAMVSAGGMAARTKSVTVAHGVAATIMDHVNRKANKTSKLPDWWKVRLRRTPVEKEIRVG